MANEYWDEMYGLEGSSRYQNEGDIGIYYRLPKFIELFYNRFPSLSKLNVLELGGGGGEIFDLFSKRYAGENINYTLTEYSSNAVSVLKNKYKERAKIIHADATNLPFEENEFDIVCAFDVMHHVLDPCKMASEMLRVTKSHFFMCEANGLSIIRRMGEMSKEAKKLEEKSYFPWQYKNFFLKSGAKSCSVMPFYFFVPPKVAKKNMKPFILISEIGQRIPIIKWQSQSLMIAGEK